MSQGAFGQSVAIDGNNVLIGAYLDDTNGVRGLGQAYLFTPDGSLVVPPGPGPGPVAVIPLPPALIMFLSGLVGLGFAAHRRAV